MVCLSTRFLSSAGRARAAQSRSILLVVETSVEERELSNLMGERIMNLCIRRINDLTESQMIKEVSLLFTLFSSLSSL